MTQRSIGIDTSILVRLVTGDPPDVYAYCVERLHALVAGGAEVFASNQVIGEAFMAVRHHYGVTSADACVELSNTLKSGLVVPFERASRFRSPCRKQRSRTLRPAHLQRLFAVRSGDAHAGQADGLVVRPATALGIGAVTPAEAGVQGCPAGHTAGGRGVGAAGGLSCRAHEDTIMPPREAQLSMASQEPLRLRFVGALVEQLGAQLYPSATAAVAELISNAWDADARNVWVTIPFGESWAEGGEIVVIDDGHGMTRNQAQERYLVLGRKRRLEDGDKTPGGRFVHGRKGIGKLAAFGTAEVLDCYSVGEGGRVSFRLDYEVIRKSAPGADTPLEEDMDTEPLLSPASEVLASGTRVRLSSLRLQRAVSEERFVTSMSRRFAIDQTEMRVFINGTQLKRFDMDLDIRYPRDAKPNPNVVVERDGWGRETLPNGKEVHWWIGFTPKPLEADYLKGISILAHHGKMLQRPFMFERSRGVHGQLGQEYLVGEVIADWLDFGADIEDDLVQTNRDQLQLEDERVQDLLEWGRRRLDWALAQRLTRRQKKAEDTLNEPDIVELIKDFTNTEQRHLVDIAKKASLIGDPEPSEVHDFMVEVVSGYKDKAVRELMQRVQVEDEDFQTNFWGLVREFSLIDARKNYSIIRARLETIDRLDAAIKAGATEVPQIHNVVKEFPWILDPRWSLLGDEIDPNTLSEQPTSTLDEETRERMDFLFILRPKEPARFDQLLVVEIKKGRNSRGRIHRVSVDEVNKFHSYALSVRDNYSMNTYPPSVSGLMIADGYTDRADRTRRSLEQVREVKLEFSTWETVIDNTRRLHTGWLEVTRRKGSFTEGQDNEAANDESA